jgi:DNA-binding helix-turn-helix protein
MPSGSKEVEGFGSLVAQVFSEKKELSGLSLRALENETGIDNSQLSRMLRGIKTMTADEAHVLAQALDTPLSQIYAEAEARLAASAQAAPELEVAHVPVMGDVDFEPIPPSEEKMLTLAANSTREDVERSRLEEIGEESQLPPEEWDE